MLQTQHVFLIGSGEIEGLLDTLQLTYTKVKELSEVPVGSEVVIDTNIKPGKKAIMEKKHNVKIYDRADVILALFKKHASPLGSLQLKLIEMQRKYAIAGDIERLKLRRQIKIIKNKIARLQQVKENPLLKLKEKGYYIVPMVGYTNAGKSTLFNILIGKQKAPTRDELFTTSIVRCGLLDLGIKVILTDTVGFIKDIPEKLIPAYHSTLNVMKISDLVIHVLDSSDHEISSKKALGEEIIKSYTNAPILTVMNKKDLIPSKKIASNAVLTSAVNKDLDNLLEEILNHLKPYEETIFLSYEKIQLLHTIPFTVHKKIEKLQGGLRITLKGKKDIVKRTIALLKKQSKNSKNPAP